MSSNAYFYKITPYQANGTVDANSLDFDQGYYRANDAAIPTWAKEYGALATICNHTIDIFAAGEEMFGQKPTSISMTGYDMDIERFHFEDGSVEEVGRDALEEFYYDDVFDGYVFNRELVAEIASPYLVEGLNALDEQVITADMAENMLRKYMADNAGELDDEYGNSYYLHPVYALAKLMFEARESCNCAAIVCYID